MLQLFHVFTRELPLVQADCLGAMAGCLWAMAITVCY